MDHNLDPNHTKIALIALEDHFLTVKEQRVANNAQMELLPTMKEASVAFHVILEHGVSIAPTSVVKVIMQTRISLPISLIVKNVIRVHMLQMMQCQLVYPVKEVSLPIQKETPSACHVLVVCGKMGGAALNVQASVQEDLMV